MAFPEKLSVLCPDLQSLSMFVDLFAESAGECIMEVPVRGWRYPSDLQHGRRFRIETWIGACFSGCVCGFSAKAVVFVVLTELTEEARR